MYARLYLWDDKQGKVVQIVSERQGEMGGDGNDLIEINIEELDSVTLWKLDKYVRSCLKPKKRKMTQQEMLLDAQQLALEARPPNPPLSAQLDLCLSLKISPRHPLRTPYTTPAAPLNNRLTRLKRSLNPPS